MNVCRFGCASPGKVKGYCDGRPQKFSECSEVSTPNVDGHLQNLGFLHVGKGLWRLAPAFDLNPFPDKDQELKTWLTEETGPVSSITEVVRVADHFWLEPAQALRILGEVYSVVKRWRTVAISPAVGMESHDLSDFAPAFEHRQLKMAASILNR